MDALATWFERFLTRRWREIVALVVLYGAFAYLRHLGLSVDLAIFALLGLLGILLLVHPIQAAARRHFQRIRWSLRFEHALAHDSTLVGHLPLVLGVDTGQSSTTLHVQLQAGTTVDDLEKNAEHIAASLRAGAVRVVRNPADASRVDIKVIVGSPLSGRVLPWLGDFDVRTDAFARLSFGVGEEGDIIRETLYEHNMFVAGEPAAGKTSLLRNIIADVVRDPMSKVYISDAKGVDFGQFRPLCAGYAGPDPDEFLNVATQVRDKMMARYAWLAASGLRKLPLNSSKGLVLFVADKIGATLTGKQGKEAAELVRDILQRGRAAGVVTVLSTQRPGSDTFPTSIRDLVGFRIAFRTPTRDASDIALGAGWASQGFDASKIAIADRGVGYFLGEGGLPRLFRSFYMDDQTEAAVIASALKLHAECDQEADHA